MSEYMPITGELRDAVRVLNCDPESYLGPELTISRHKFHRLCDAIDSVHSALEAECERLRGEWDFWESTHVELPKDADGEYIRIGDVMECLLDGVKKVLRVGYMTYRPDGWHVALTIEDNFKYQSYAPKELRHHHAPTVEDVLREFADEVYADADNEIRDRDFLCAKYAKRLTLAGDAE